MPKPLPLVSPGTESPPSKVSRRRFVTGSGAALATTGIGAIAVATQEAAGPALAQDMATPEAASPVAASPVAEVAHGADQEAAIAFFNPIEARMVEAITARIMPGSPDDPGAREASVVNYIDRALSGPNLGIERKTYTQGPFLRVSEEQVPVEASSAPDIYRSIEVNPDDVSRYGYQSILTPQEIYRRGLEAVNAYAQSQFEADFVDLTEEQQDSILTDMEADTATGFEGPSARAFFTQLRNDTIEGFFCDPLYGGNRNLVGWKLIGYPGPQLFYLPEDLTNESFAREPQSLTQLLDTAGH